MRFHELDQIRLVATPEVRERHLAAVSRALSTRPQRSLGRPRLMAVVLAIVLLLPVVALAAEDAVPGDFLYPLKRVVEPVVQMFDSSAPAERRVREVEVLLERDSPDEVIVRHLDVARDVVTDDQPDLSQRIDRVVHELETRRDQAPTTDEPAGETDRPDEVDETPLVPSDREDVERGSTTTTSTVVETIPDANEPNDRRTDG